MLEWATSQWPQQNALPLSLAMHSISWLVAVTSRPSTGLGPRLQYFIQNGISEACTGEETIL